MAIKNLHHICIQTEDYNKSLDFYTRVLGFEMVMETPDFHGRDYNTWLKLGSLMIEMQTPKNGENFNECTSLNAGIAHMCFLADNLEEELNWIKGLGCTSFKKKEGKEIYKVENGALFKIIAPEGTIIEIRDSEEL